MELDKCDPKPQCGTLLEKYSDQIRSCLLISEKYEVQKKQKRRKKKKHQACQGGKQQIKHCTCHTTSLVNSSLILQGKNGKLCFQAWNYELLCYKRWRFWNG